MEAFVTWIGPIVVLALALVVVWHARRQYGPLRREWRDVQLELASTLEKVHVWAARQARRDSRAAQRLLESQQQPDQRAVPLDPKARKAALRRMVAGGQVNLFPNAPARSDGHLSAQPTGEDAE